MLVRTIICAIKAPLRESVAFLAVASDPFVSDDAETKFDYS